MKQRELRLCVILLALYTVCAAETTYYDPQKGWFDDTHPCDRGVMPVTESLFLRDVDFEDSFDFALTKGDEPGFMTDEEVEMYIAARYSNGEVTAEDWLQSFNLFEACMWLAYKNQEKPEERKHWLSMALDAARRNLQYDCLNSEIVSTASREFESKEDFAPDRDWFFGRLADLYRDHLEGDERQRAITLHNIGKTLSEKGDLSLAKEAFLSAHQLFPEDNIILRSLKETYEALGDHVAAIDALGKIGWTLKEEDMRSINGLVNAAINAINAGDLYFLLNDVDNAEKLLKHAWAYLNHFDIEYAEQSAIWESEYGIPRRDPTDMNARYYNKCATGLGLCALARGDLKRAVVLFKESFVSSKHMVFDGYDLRLVKELMKDPALRKLCISYLQLALEPNFNPNREEAMALLAELTKGEHSTETGHIRANSRDATTTSEGDGNAAMPIEKPTSSNDQSKERSKKGSNHGATVAIIVAIAIAVVMANQRKRKKGAHNDNSENNRR